jgi:hypothetical protein
MRGALGGLTMLVEIVMGAEDGGGEGGVKGTEVVGGVVTGCCCWVLGPGFSRWGVLSIE